MSNVGVHQRHVTHTHLNAIPLPPIQYVNNIPKSYRSYSYELRAGLNVAKIEEIAAEIISMANSINHIGWHTESKV